MGRDIGLTEVTRHAFLSYPLGHHAAMMLIKRHTSGLEKMGANVLNPF